MTAVLNFRGPSPPDLPPLVGSSPAMRLARSRVERFAKTGIPVLLAGPTGTGKELLARYLHALSGRPGDMVDVNCGALPRDMTENLLFGHRKGAFTGAVESTVGLITRADGGTLFLDELSSLTHEGQATLLRVLETGEVLALGAVNKVRVDVRLVAAVQDDIDTLIHGALFRRDLFYRVAGLRIDLPPLSGRPEDIPLLANHFAEALQCSIPPSAAALLQGLPWPGNVRELRFVIERAAVLASTPVLERELVLEALAASPTSVSAANQTADLLRVCRHHAGRADAIAAELGISRATLFRRLRAAGVSLRQSQSISQS